MSDLALCGAAMVTKLMKIGFFDRAKEGKNLLSVTCHMY